MNSERIGSSCSTCDTRRATIMVKHVNNPEWDKDKIRITTQGVWLRQKECDYDKMNVITTKGMWLRQKECDYDKRNVITTKGMWRRQKKCDYVKRNVIMTIGMWLRQKECEHD